MLEQVIVQTVLATGVGAPGLPMVTNLKPGSDAPVQQGIAALDVAHVHVVKVARFAELSLLQDDWDGEGAARPSIEAIRRASDATTWAHGAGLVVEDIDADVLGGVGLWVRAYAHRGARTVWIACMNNGQDTAVLSEGRSVVGHQRWDASEATKASLGSFLVGERADARA
jgi:hypothetical protein